MNRGSVHRGSVQGSVRRKVGWQWGVLVAVLLCAALWVAQSAIVAAQAGNASPGYYYTVQAGDSWDTVAASTGLAVEALQAANPDAVRDNEWLLVGEQLLIPTSLSTAPKTHSVAAGESWNSIAAKYGVSVDLLKAANPNSIRTGNILYRGEVLIIPPAGASLTTPTPAAGAGTPTPTTTTTTATTEATEAAAEITPEAAVTGTATVTATATVTTTAAPDVEPEATLTATAEITATPAVTGTAAVTSSGEITATGTPTATGAAATGAVGDLDLPPCPERFADYATAMTELVNATPEAEGAVSGLDAVVAYLTACEALAEDGAVVQDLNGDGIDDLVVAYQNPNAEQIFVEGDLAIFNSGTDGYTLGYRARAAGEVRLLSVEDVNADEQPDVIWVDTTCGASTCFDTVNVRSWDGSAWADWTDGTITMAYAEISLADELEEGSGSEIVLDGGIYGSVGAGPQRSRTEIWASVDGAPYALLEKSYSASECLYHTVLDANRAFLEAPVNGFEAATALYTQAATNTSLIKCWVRNDELNELRSFSQFRLALIAGYTGDAEGAAAAVATLTEQYPNSVYAGVGQTWLDAYEAEGDVVAACEAVTSYAEENSSVWEILADYGYTNPSFEAVDVCPILDVGAEAPEEGTPEGAPTEEGEGGTSSPSTSELAAGATAPAAVSLCPDTLAGYGDALLEVLAEVGPEADAISGWLQECGAAWSEPPVVVTDLNDDNLADVVALPTLISDLGLGPRGAQGALLVFTSLAGGGFELAATPESFGAPELLAVEDLNLDGRMDVAWSVTACATACALEVQILTWGGEALVPMIQPGAMVAEGTAIFGPVQAGDAGQGMALILTGGVSGGEGSGLAVSHTENWQSIGGAPYARITWRYDTDAAESECLGLRLVEGDVAMQAARLIGYDAAIDAYRTALAAPTNACSIYGMDPTTEITLLQGLAIFRLVQAQAYGGEVQEAVQSLAAWLQAQMDNPYSAVAVDWLAEYERSGDGQAACEGVRAALDAEPMLWQVTDQFGYDHPALGADQICFVP